MHFKKGKKDTTLLFSISYKYVLMDSTDLFKIRNYKTICCTLYYLIITHKRWRTYCPCLKLLSGVPELHGSSFKSPQIAKGWKSLSWVIYFFCEKWTEISTNRGAIVCLTVSHLFRRQFILLLTESQVSVDKNINQTLCAVTLKKLTACRRSPM